MKSGKKNKKQHSPKPERTYPGLGVHEQESPVSPGRNLSKPGFLSRFRSSKSTPQETTPPPLTTAGRVTPEQSESGRTSSEKQKSRDSSPKSPTMGLASSTYRNLSHSLTDLAGFTSRPKPTSPEIEAIAPPLPSPRSVLIDSPPPEKQALLPFKPETIQRQGWLNRRPESDLKRPKPGGNTTWKLQRAVLHENKLYLYTPPSSLGVRAFAPSPPTENPSNSSLQPQMSHVKHAHSPSEGGTTPTNAGHIVLDELGPRPSTAPNAFQVTGIF